MKALRRIYWSLVAVCIVLTGGTLWWALNPSSSYMVVTGIQVVREENGWYVLSGRRLPYGDVTANWALTITVLRPDMSFVCYNAGRSAFKDVGSNVVKYKLGTWAQDCMEAGPPISIRLSRTVLWNNLIPLRPLHYEISLELPATDEGQRE